jgi:hypothetical protein
MRAGKKPKNKNKNSKTYVVREHTGNLIGSLGLASSTANQSHVKQCDALIGEQNIVAMSHTRTFGCRIGTQNVNGANKITFKKDTDIERKRDND